MRMVVSLGLCAVLLVIATRALAHAEHEKPRYVAASGADRGDCGEMFRPCRTIGYAVSRAAKGDRILVAAGEYPIDDGEELFALISTATNVRGGFSRFDHYQVSEPLANDTVLIGASSQYRSLLSSKGFRLIADGKAVSREVVAEGERLLEKYQATQKSNPPTPCNSGQAGSFPCSDVDLLAHLALADFSSRPTAANDIWGFRDLNTEREYALIGLRNATAVVDVTNPNDVFEVGSIPGQGTTWRDIKVYQFFDSDADRWRAYAYVTADSATDRLTVIDMGGLPNSVSLTTRATPDLSAHNVMISNVSYATGVPTAEFPTELHVGGSNLSNGAFRVFDVANPQLPTLAAQSPSGGYMHDAAVFTIDDGRAASACGGATQCQVLADFNETSFELWRLNGSTQATQLASRTYSDVGYVHSGWFSDDRNYLFVHDELDEQNSALNTTLRIFGLADLANPTLAATWTGPTSAIDHNGYAHGSRYYMSNYTRGLTILDISNPTAPREAGYFDTLPSSNAASFNGAWGVYPFLPSGNLLVSDINSGLYVLADRTADQGSGQLRFTAASFGGVEGDTVQIGVTRDGSLAGPASVAYRVVPGSADGADYTASNGVLTWAAGEGGEKSAPVQLTADGQSEGVERFAVELFDSRSGAVLSAPAFASVFVSDQSGVAAVEFDILDLAVDESQGRVVLTMQRRDSVSGLVEVDYATAGGSAESGTDFGAGVAGRLSWPDGDGTARTITIPLLDDSETEGEESFTVSLTAVNSNTFVGANATATIRITDNDAANSVPVADAGADQTVNAGNRVQLNGNGSSDADGDALSFAWSQASGPPVALQDGNSAVATFTAPTVSRNTDLVFELTVSDASGGSAIAATTVTVQPASAAAGGGGGGGAMFWLLALLGAMRLLVRPRF